MAAKKAAAESDAEKPKKKSKSTQKSKAKSTQKAKSKSTTAKSKKADSARPMGKAKRRMSRNR